MARTQQQTPPSLTQEVVVRAQRLKMHPVWAAAAGRKGSKQEVAEMDRSRSAGFALPCHNRQLPTVPSHRVSSTIPLFINPF